MVVFKNYITDYIIDFIIDTILTIIILIIIHIDYIIDHCKSVIDLNIVTIIKLFTKFIIL